MKWRRNSVSLSCPVGCSSAQQPRAGRRRQVPNGSYATRSRQQVDCFQSCSHWQLPQLRLDKHQSVRLLVSNIPQRFKPPVRAAPIGTLGSLIHPQEQLWPFDKEGWTLLGIRVALLATGTAVETRQKDRQSHVCLVERPRRNVRSAKL
jgi:hypothetical protein